MSFVCDVCHKSTGSTYSELVAEIRENKKKQDIHDGLIDNNTTTITDQKSKLAHIECCTIEQIKQILLSQAKDQISFYQDVLDLMDDVVMVEGKDRVKKEELERKKEDLFITKATEFEKKNGSFDEMRQGTGIDHNLITFALISELKKKKSQKNSKC